ncbi:hypothetical protein [Hominisplanchenecus sp.]|uniref:hypothetical protein n=1 Tax=Hominisplanchenecus sp. TaxID=3038130 RepID=UPI0039953598
MKKMTVEQIVAAFDEIAKNDSALECLAKEVVKRDDLYRNDKEDAFVGWMKEDSDFLDNLKKHIRTHILRDDYYCEEDIDDIAEKLGTECYDNQLAYDFERLWNDGKWNEEIRDISILMEDHCTYEEAMNHLKTCTIYDDLEEKLEKYLEDWCTESFWGDKEDDDYKELCVNIRKMIATKNPCDCWGVVERKDKTYYVEYCL